MGRRRRREARGEQATQGRRRGEDGHRVAAGRHVPRDFLDARSGHVAVERHDLDRTAPARRARGSAYRGAPRAPRRAHDRSERRGAPAQRRAPRSVPPRRRQRATPHMRASAWAVAGPTAATRLVSPGIVRGGAPPWHGRTAPRGAREHDHVNVARRSSARSAGAGSCGGSNAIVGRAATVAPSCSRIRCSSPQRPAGRVTRIERPPSAERHAPSRLGPRSAPRERASRPAAPAASIRSASPPAERRRLGQRPALLVEDRFRSFRVAGERPQRDLPRGDDRVRRGRREAATAEAVAGTRAPRSRRTSVGSSSRPRRSAPVRASSARVSTAIAPCPTAGRQISTGRATAGARGDPEPLDPGQRQHERVELAVDELAHPRVHVPAHRDRTQIGTHVQELRATPRAARSEHGRPRRSSAEGLARARHERVARVVSREHRGEPRDAPAASVGRSFRLCTARSISPASSACSSRRTNTPTLLRPKASAAIDGHLPCAGCAPRCAGRDGAAAQAPRHVARLPQRERAASRAEDQPRTVRRHRGRRGSLGSVRAASPGPAPRSVRRRRRAPPDAEDAPVQRGALGHVATAHRALQVAHRPVQDLLDQRAGQLLDGVPLPVVEAPETTAEALELVLPERQEPFAQRRRSWA